MTPSLTRLSSIKGERLLEQRKYDILLNPRERALDKAQGPRRALSIVPDVPVKLSEPGQKGFGVFGSDTHGLELEKHRRHLEYPQYHGGPKQKMFRNFTPAYYLN